MSNCAVGGLNFASPQNARFVEVRTDRVYLGGFQQADLENDLFDCFVLSDDVNNAVNGIIEAQPPQISLGRILTHRFTKEQIKAVNECRELPKNAKFKGNARIGITWNLFDITKGTHKLPAGYELKNDILGYTHVVREGTKSLFIR